MNLKTIANDVPQQDFPPSNFVGVVSVNLNEYLYFKPTEHAHKVYDFHFKKMNLKFSSLAERIKQGGWVEMQMHEFMNIFGESLYCGGDVVAEGNNIFFFNRAK